MQKVIINSPSLDPSKNVSGISAVVQFIMNQNAHANYIHFEIGRKDDEHGGMERIKTIFNSIKEWKRLLKNHPDALVHFNFALTKLSIIRDSLYIHFVKKNKLVVHLHGGNYLFADDMPFYISWLLKRLFKKDIAFIVLSDKEKERIIEKYHAKKVFTLPNCVDLSEAKNFERHISHEHLTLGYIGRIAETKGMKELLEACTTLKKEGFPFKLIIAGSERNGNVLTTQFQNALGDNFEYAGVVSGASKTQFFKAIDVFMLPSYFEGLPISLLETMGFGCVPITTDVGSINTVVQDGENGLFVRVKNSEDIVNQIKRLVSEKSLIEKLSLNARQTIFMKFDPNLYMAKLQLIYES
jgi:glycosyltransferase involved in cell wall biosynthesis